MGAVTTTEVVDVGEKRTQRGHRVLPAVERARLIAAYQASGMTMAAFARRESIKYATLAGWIFRATRSSPAPRPIEFAQVQLPGPSVVGASRAAALEVRLPDGILVRGGRVADLAALIRALRS